MKKYRFIIVAGLLCLILVGCSSRENISDIEIKLLKIQENLADVEKDNKELKERIGTLEKRIDGSDVAEIPATKPVKTSAASLTQSPTLTDTHVQEPRIGQFFLKDPKYPIAPNTTYDQEYALKTDKYDIRFIVPADAINLSVTEEKLSYDMINDWLEVKHTYQVISEIKNAPECELKIKEITKDLPLSLDEKYHPLYFLQDLPNNYHAYQNGWLEDNGISLDDVWYISLTQHGAAYFYESSTFSKGNLLYNTMVQESYDFISGVAIHGVIEVKNYDYVSYYNSLATNIEKSEAELAHNTMMGKSLRPNEELTYTYGFQNCLLKPTKLKKNN